ncbi:hypothetical protein B0J14DRAFT_333953 [Halenospora varia]|nr:hypothetical protein B0J14DRAFT_333953 [Halenospora varia]
MHFAKDPAVDRAVLVEHTLLNNKKGHWWNDKGLRTLNFLLFVPLRSEYVQGFDASLINNVQQLPIWQKEFHHPDGSLLGVIGASYWVARS